MDAKLGCEVGVEGLEETVAVDKAVLARAARGEEREGL
jgi:hypothetical protein